MSNHRDIPPHVTLAVAVVMVKIVKIEEVAVRMVVVAVVDSGRTAGMMVSFPFGFWYTNSPKMRRTQYIFYTKL